MDYVRFLTSFLILIVPTFLMGGTLPVLARFFTEAVQEVQRKVGLLYALNTFGAAFGTLAAALFFVPQLGNTRSTLPHCGFEHRDRRHGDSDGFASARDIARFQSSRPHRLAGESDGDAERRTGSFLRLSQHPDLCR